MFVFSLCRTRGNNHLSSKTLNLVKIFIERIFIKSNCHISNYKSLQNYTNLQNIFKKFTKKYYILKT
jgi:hypothetical protein